MSPAHVSNFTQSAPDVASTMLCSTCQSSHNQHLMWPLPCSAVVLHSMLLPCSALLHSILRLTLCFMLPHAYCWSRSVSCCYPGVACPPSLWFRSEAAMAVACRCCRCGRRPLIGSRQGHRFGVEVTACGAPPVHVCSTDQGEQLESMRCAHMLRSKSMSTLASDLSSRCAAGNKVTQE